MEERYYAGGRDWRPVVSAWAVALLVFAAFAGLQSPMASRPAAARPADLAGVIIPTHDPLCSDGQCRDGPSLSAFANFPAADYTVW